MQHKRIVDANKKRVTARKEAFELRRTFLQIGPRKVCVAGQASQAAYDATFHRTYSRDSFIVDAVLHFLELNFSLEGGEIEAGGAHVKREEDSAGHQFPILGQPGVSF